MADQNSTFTMTVAVLKALNQKGDLYVSMRPPLGLDFKASRRAISEACSRHAVSVESFSSDLSEVAEALLALLLWDENKAIDQFSEKLKQVEVDLPEADRRSSDELLEEARLRVSSVREALYSERLQLRYDLKRSSKAPAFGQIDWDIKIKIADANEDSPKPFPYATIKLEYQKSFGGDPWLFFGDKLLDSVQVNFSQDDVVYLRRVLNEIEASLGKAEEECRKLSPSK